MHPFKVLLALGIVSILAVMCTTATNLPSDTEMLRQAGSALQQRYGSIATIEPLAVVNGSGSKDAYAADVRYRMTFTSTLANMLEQVRERARASFNYVARQAAEEELAQLRQQFGEFKAGETAEHQEHFNFLATPEGWVLQP